MILNLLIECKCQLILNPILYMSTMAAAQVQSISIQIFYDISVQIITCMVICHNSFLVFLQSHPLSVLLASRIRIL